MVKSLAISAVQTKMTMRFHLTPVKMLKTKNVRVHAREYIEQGEHPFTAGESTNLYSHLENQYGNFRKLESFKLKTQLYYS